jgi:hypothetical protein
MECVGSFDVVHVRHIHLVIKNHKVVPIIKNLRALLSTSAHVPLLCLVVVTTRKEPIMLAQNPKAIFNGMKSIPELS